MPCSNHSLRTAVPVLLLLLIWLQPASGGTRPGVQTPDPDLTPPQPSPLTRQERRRTRVQQQIQQHMTHHGSAGHMTCSR